MLRPRSTPKGGALVTDLERIGDLAINICERAIDLSRVPEVRPWEDIPGMAAIVRGYDDRMKSAHHSLPRRIALVTLASGLSAGTALWGAQEASSEVRSSPLANEVTQLAELVERQQQQIEEQRRLLEAQGLLLRRLSEDVEELRQGAPTLTRASWSESGPAAALAAAPAPADEAAGSLAAAPSPFSSAQPPQRKPRPRRKPRP